MITTVTLNAAIDRTYYVPQLTIGGVARIGKMYSEAGGKGINVAKVISQLGHPVTAAGFIGGSNGDFICRELDNKGIAHDFVRVTGESRICLNVIDETTGTSTEMLEAGPTISEEEMNLFSEKLRDLAGQSFMVCISGSLPKGVPAAYYAQLIDIVKSSGALVFLDSSGEGLLQGVKAAPSFIKPNEEELAQLLGEVSDKGMVWEKLNALHDKGIQGVCVTLGSQGSMISYLGKRYKVTAPSINAVNTVGCGDSFVAGFSVGLNQGKSIEDCLALATAVASANALSEKAGSVKREDVERLLSQTTIEEIQ